MVIYTNVILEIKLTIVVTYKLFLNFPFCAIVFSVKYILNVIHIRLFLKNKFDKGFLYTIYILTWSNYCYMVCCVIDSKGNTNIVRFGWDSHKRWLLLRSPTINYLIRGVLYWLYIIIIKNVILSTWIGWNLKYYHYTSSMSKFYFSKNMFPYIYALVLKFRIKVILAGFKTHSKVAWPWKQDMQ